MINKQTTLISFRKEKEYIILISVFTFLALFFGSRMSFFYATNEWSDVNLYFNMAKAMLNGRVLYTEVFDHKGPFIFFIYGLGYLISNDSFLGMFLIQIVLWLLAMYAVYFTARLFLSQSISFFVTLITALFLLKLIKAGGSVEEFVLLFEFISMYFILRFFISPEKSSLKYNYMFIHGLLSSIVIFTKINLVIFWVFPLIGIFTTILLNKEYKVLFKNILAYLIGFSIITALVIGYLYVNDALIEAYNVYIDLNIKYSNVSGAGRIITSLINLIALSIEPMSLMLMFPLGVFLFSGTLLKNKIGHWSILLSGLSLYFAIFSSSTLQIYYPLPLLVFSMLGLVAIAFRLEKYLGGNFSVKSLVFLTILFNFVAVSIKSPLTNTRVETWILGDKAFTPTVITHKLVKEIKKEKNPTLLNLGFGLANNLFTTCNIVPNVKYFVRPNLTYHIYPQLRNEQVKYIEEKKTLFIVVPSYIYEKNSVMLTDPDNNTNYYLNLPVFQQNYEFVIADTVINTVDQFNTLEIYRLFKKKE